MRIHLLCDHKWRDLPNLSAVKARLEKLGHTVLLSTTKDSRAMIGAFRPDCVVLNHLFSEENRKLVRTLKASGVTVVILPTEGAMRPELRTLSEGEFSDFRLADLILAWSQPSAENIRLRWGLSAEQVPVTGCSRLDFYHQEFSGVLDTRESFCRKYGLDESRPIVTWATQYVYAHVGTADTSPNFVKWYREFQDVGATKCYERIGIDPIRIPMSHARGREAAAKSFFALAKAMPAVQFLIKPHPVEELDFYIRWIKESGCENIRFCPATYIWNVLNSTDIQLHRQCTTAVETWMWNKPTIEMAMDIVPEMIWEDREEGSDIACDTDTLVDLVCNYLSNPIIVEAQLSHRWKHINQWFGPTDGRRCIEVAETISNFLMSHAKRRSYFSSLPDLNAPFKKSVGASLRYGLNMLPDTPFFGKKKFKTESSPHDKLITRQDVLDYQKILPALLRN